MAEGHARTAGEKPPISTANGRRGWWCAAVLASGGACALPTALVVTSDAPDDSEADRLYEVDLTTARASLRGVLADRYEDVEGLAFSSEGQLFGIDDATKTLLQIDARSAALTLPGRLAGNTHLPASISEIDDPGIAFTCDGRLLLSSTRGKLFVLRQSDGLATQVGTGVTMAVNITDLAVRGNQVYGLGQDGLYRIDPDLGTSALIGAYGHGIRFNGGGGLAFDDAGVLWAVADRSPSAGSAVYRIDPESGTATASGTLALKGIDSLTIAPARCTPDSVAGVFNTPVPALGRSGSVVMLLLLACGGLLSLCLQRRP